MNVSSLLLQTLAYLPTCLHPHFYIHTYFSQQHRSKMCYLNKNQAMCRTAQWFLLCERKQKPSNTRTKTKVGDISNIAGLRKLGQPSVCRRGARICGLLLESRRGLCWGYSAGCILFIFVICSSAVPEETAMSVAVFLPLLCHLLFLIIIFCLWCCCITTQSLRQGRPPPFLRCCDRRSFFVQHQMPPSLVHEKPKPVREITNLIFLPATKEKPASPATELLISLFLSIFPSLFSSYSGTCCG